MKVFGIIGWKNSGKTGLVERLVGDLTARGLIVSTLKHAHHAFDVDQPGKDSYRHRAAGAREVLLASAKRWVLMHELHDDEPDLDEHLRRISDCDLVLVEGFKRSGIPSIEANRAETRHALIAPTQANVLAVASDQPHPDLDIPCFDLDDTTAIADFILAKTGLVAPTGKPTAPTTLLNDCFALPKGVDWLPVDDALDLLKSTLSPVVGSEEIATADAGQRVLATDQLAPRSNPPGANSAVDGYGIAHATGATTQSWTLLEGRAAAGAPFKGAVQTGQAVRILTGALLPVGVNTVIMDEDVTQNGNRIHVSAPPKAGANARNAGEDVLAGQTALRARHVLRAPDLALLSGLGVANVMVHQRLRVGVLSTGDEIVPPDGGNAPAQQTYDANSPMLLSLAQTWGYEAVDLGHIADDRASLQARLDDASSRVDVILATGGASAGDEDHVSALLKEQSALQAWRIALKPGRPLALGMWQGTPILGLPGNPVAAFVCAVVFARPSLSVLAGSGWLTPQGFDAPAAFEKSKKPGRREYLRARLNDNGRVEVFHSEGSGRISGLSWANGLVELGEDAQVITKGTPVRFLPYASFGI